MKLLHARQRIKQRGRVVETWNWCQDVLSKESLVGIVRAVMMRTVLKRQLSSNEYISEDTSSSWGFSE